MSLEPSDSNNSDFSTFVEFKARLERGTDAAVIGTELGELLSINLGSGIKILGALCNDQAEIPEFVLITTHICLKCLTQDNNAPEKMFDLGLSALSKFFELSSGATDGAEYLYMYSRYAPDKHRCMELLQAAEVKLRNTIASSINQESANRAKAFLAQTMIDLSITENAAGDELRLSEALKLIDQIPIDQKFVFLYLVEGQACLALADYYDNSKSEAFGERAIKSFQVALAHSQNDSEILTGIVNSLILLADMSAGKKADEYLNLAKHYCEKLLRLNENDPDALCAMGNIHSVRANFREGSERMTFIKLARNFFNQAIEKDAHHINLLQGLGNQAISAAERPLISDWKLEVAEGEKAFNSILDLDSANYNAMYGLATIYRFRQRSTNNLEVRRFAYEEGTRLLEACITARPEQVTAYLALGEIIRESVVFSASSKGKREHEDLLAAQAIYAKGREFAPRDIYLKLAMLSISSDLLEFEEKPEKVIDAATQIATDLMELSVLLENSSSIIQSYSALLNKVDLALHKIGEEFPGPFMLFHIEKIDKLSELSVLESRKNPLKHFQFATRSETLIAFKAQAHFIAGDYDKSVHALETGSGQYFNSDNGVNTECENKKLENSDCKVYIWSLSRTSTALIKTSIGFVPIALPAACRNTLLKQIANIEDAYRASTHHETKNFRIGSSSLLNPPIDSWNLAIMDLLKWMGNDLSPLWTALAENDLNQVDWVAQGLWGLCPLHASILSDGRCFFEKYQTRYWFSTSSARLRTASDIPNIRQLTVFVDPEYDQQPTLEYGSAEANFFKKLNNDNVLNILLFQKANASRHNFLALDQDSLSGNILHLSCHGSAAAIDPRDCFLYFSGDETVSFTEILESDALSGLKLVFLSSCESGFRSRYILDEAISMHTAFLATGVENTINALWAVSDQMTAELTEVFYEQLALGKDIGQSLSNSCSWIKDRYGTRSAHVWAGFQHWHHD